MSSKSIVEKKTFQTSLPKEEVPKTLLGLENQMPQMSLP